MMNKLHAFLLTALLLAHSAFPALVAHWDFSDQTYNDQAGSLDGTAAGSVSVVASGSDRFSYALQTTASGNNVNYLNIGNIGSLGIYSNSFTLSYWVKTSQNTVDAGSGEVWESYSGSSSLGYEGIVSTFRKSTQVNAGKLYTTVAENGTTSTKLLNNGVLADDEWHWIVIWYDGSSDSLKYFEDGVHIVYRDETRIATLATQDARDARLGDGFGGLIGDVRIYDTALSFIEDESGTVTGGELAEMYAEPELVQMAAHWDFSGGSYDDMVGSNNGTPHGVYSIVASGNAHFANALEVGPTRNSDYFDVGTLLSLNSSTNSFTLSYWVKKAAFTNANGYVNTFESKASDMGITTVLRASNVSSPSRAYTTVEGYDGVDHLLNGDTVADDQWHWIVIRYDGETDIADYFEDGHFYDTETGIFSLTAGTRNIFIGNGLDGLVGDIRIYTNALTYVLDGNNDIVDGELASVPKNWGVEYTACPIDMQLFPRNLATDTAVVNVSGQLTNTDALAVSLQIYRDDVLSSGSTQSLVFADGVASFSFASEIAAETNNYDFELLVLEDDQETLVRRVEDVVAGDVFIIQGQSNADAKMYTGSANENQHPFLRTFGVNSDTASVIESNTRWLTAVGDGSRDVVGGVGQWGFRMGRLLIDAYHVPVAVLNGAHGGQAISFFQRNDTEHEDLETNYGRLLFRAEAAGVADAVRAILWYQGESDNGDADAHETGFIALYNDWKEDYPSVERFYIHQVRVGCGVDKEDVDLRDRQRCLPDSYSDMSVMSTTGVNGHEGCHYAYEDGYKVIGNHITALLSVDLYGSTNTANVTAPNVDHAYFSSPASDEITIVVRRPEDALTLDAAIIDDLILEGSAVTVTNAEISGDNAIVLSLSGDASDATGLTYTGHSYDGAWVTNGAGVGLLTFYNVSIAPADDQDADGLSNDWEEHYFGTVTGASPEADVDQDGQDNLQEYIAGSDPTNQASVFTVQCMGDASLSWAAVSGRLYSVFWSSNLFSSFQCLESNIVWENSDFVDEMHTADTKGFYQITVYFP